MGKKGMERAYGFSLDVINEIERAIKEAGMTKRQALAKTGMSQGYFYDRMRGDKPFTTNDITQIAEALGMDAFIILRRAARKADSQKVMSVEEREAITNAKIDRLDLTLAAMTDDNKRAEAQTVIE